MSTLRILLQIAWRNLFSSLMNLVIGLLVFLGTVLLVVGDAALDSVDRAMTSSIISSAAGHIQVYSSRSKDDLSLFDVVGGEPDLVPFEDFSRLKKTIQSVGGVKAVIPMGINGALITSGNAVDLALAKLRDLERDRSEGRGGLASREQSDSLKAHVKHMAQLLQDNLLQSRALWNEKAVDQEALAALDRALSDEFWHTFEQAPFDALEFLENEIAPLAADSDLLYLRYVGTDLQAFQRAFDRMEIVDGQPVPPGRRGMLLSKRFYEDQIKLKSARRLDRIHEVVTTTGRKIATDQELQRWVKENQTQLRELLFLLDPIKTRQATIGLRGALRTQEADIRKLLFMLFSTDDDNFLERYRIFYEQIAPLVELYRIRPGDMLTIKAATRGGYMQSVNIRVYGTFRFQGLEHSYVAGTLSLMDLSSFRDLYGYLGADKLEEIQQMKLEAGSQPVDRGNAESELFGDAQGVVGTATLELIDDQEAFRNPARARLNEGLDRRVYSQEEIEGGVVLNAAVFLEDLSRLPQALGEVEAAGRRDGLPLKAVSWQRASGLTGQFVTLAKVILYVAVAIIFLVTMIIINNATMMATLQRVREIGTLRAIGAQRSFVLSMVLTETLLLSLVFGISGVLVGGGLVQLAGAWGIPAPNEMFHFFFSGPRLYPGLGGSTLAGAFLSILLITCASTFYPALLATRVAPVTAMQAED